MIYLRKGAETVVFDSSNKGRAFASAYLSAGWEEYDPETGEIVPQPVIPKQWASGAWRPGLPEKL